MLDRLIQCSEWWRRATQAHDGHFPDSQDVTLADHLEATACNIHRLLIDEPSFLFAADLRKALVDLNLQINEAIAILYPVALLHDIGKLIEAKGSVISHPITRKPVEARHPVLGLQALQELLPQDTPHWNTIAAVIEQHDTPHRWYKQYEKTGVIPTERAWLKLGRKINAPDQLMGLALLAVFDAADVHGHYDLGDVVWFFEKLNAVVLRKRSKWLPVPTDEDLGESE